MPKGKFKKLKLIFIDKDHPANAGEEEEKGLTDQQQAQKIFDIMHAELKEEPNPTSVGITYSANHEQTEALRAYYANPTEKTWGTVIEQFTDSTSQGAVMREFLTLLNTEELRQQFRILPISTMSYKTAGNKTTNEWLQADMQAIHNFAENNGCILGWQNQGTKADQYAIGGGIAGKAFSDEQSDYVQACLATLNKEINDSKVTELSKTQLFLDFRANAIVDEMLKEENKPEKDTLNDISTENEIAALKNQLAEAQADLKEKTKITEEKSAEAAKKQQELDDFKKLGEGDNPIEAQYQALPGSKVPLISSKPEQYKYKSTLIQQHIEKLSAAAEEANEAAAAALNQENATKEKIAELDYKITPPPSTPPVPPPESSLDAVQPAEEEHESTLSAAPVISEKEKQIVTLNSQLEEAKKQLEIAKAKAEKLSNSATEKMHKNPKADVWSATQGASDAAEAIRNQKTLEAKVKRLEDQIKHIQAQPESAFEKSSAKTSAADASPGKQLSEKKVDHIKRNWSRYRMLINHYKRAIDIAAHQTNDKQFQQIQSLARELLGQLKSQNLHDALKENEIAALNDKYIPILKTIIETKHDSKNIAFFSDDYELIQENEIKSYPGTLDDLIQTKIRVLCGISASDVITPPTGGLSSQIKEGVKTTEAFAVRLNHTEVTGGHVVTVQRADKKNNVYSLDLHLHPAELADPSYQGSLFARFPGDETLKTGIKELQNLLANNPNSTGPIRIRPNTPQAYADTWMLYLNRLGIKYINASGHKDIKPDSNKQKAFDERITAKRHTFLGSDDLTPVLAPKKLVDKDIAKVNKGKDDVTTPGPRKG